MVKYRIVKKGDGYGYYIIQKRVWLWRWVRVGKPFYSTRMEAERELNHMVSANPLKADIDVIDYSGEDH